MAAKNNSFRKRFVQHKALVEETWLNQQSRSRQQSFAQIHLHAISKNFLLPGLEEKHSCQWLVGDAWGFEIAECPRKIIQDKKIIQNVNAMEVLVMPPGNTPQKRTILLDMPEKQEQQRYYLVLDRNIYVEQMFRVEELGVVKLKDQSLFMEKIDSLYSYVKSGRAEPEKISVLIFECLTLIYASTILPPEKMAGLPLYQLRQVTSYPQNFPTLASLVNFFGVSRPTLTALFRKHTGCSPMEFVIESKLNNSIWHLQHTDSSISEIALLHGYKDAAYYCNAFKKQFGVSPARYREKFLENSRKQP